MAAYNTAKYLDEAVCSVLNQTFSDFELILIDDGSTDSTLSIMENYARSDKRVLVCRQENAGPASARNLGMTMATGEWLAILDADDIALPDRLAWQLAYVETKPGIVLLGGGCIEVDAAGEYLKTHHYPARHSQLVRNMEKRRKFPPHSSCLYHTETVKQLGGFNTKFVRSQDLDLWLRLSEAGTIACLPAPVIKLRKHSEGISRHNQGRTAIVYGMAARTCHFLRLYGFSDPSSLETPIWDSFISWLTTKLEQFGEFAIADNWLRWRREWYQGESSNIVAKGMRLAKQIILSPDGLTPFTRRLFGSNLAIQLAQEWMKSQTHQRSLF
jgi:glycosyltransferase involved in cell wall biosynthesis